MKKVQDIRKMTAGPRSGDVITPYSKTKILHWRGPASSFMRQLQRKKITPKQYTELRVLGTIGKGGTKLKDSPLSSALTHSSSSEELALLLLSLGCCFDVCDTDSRLSDDLFRGHQVILLSFLSLRRAFANQVEICQPKVSHRLVADIEHFFWAAAGGARHLINRQNILTLHEKCDVIYYLG